MSTIPISEIITVNPGVLSAAGGALDLLGMVLTQNTRVPIGMVAPFANPAAVGAYFGLNSKEYGISEVYFAGFDTKTAIPGSINFTQYNQAAVAAFMRGGNISGLTLAQLQALTGTLAITIDGYSWSDGSLSLAAATSFSNAASIITTGLTGSVPVGASVTGSIAAETASFTGSIAGNVLYVTAVASSLIVPGEILNGTGVTASTMITSQLSGTANGIGTYAVNIAQVTASTTISGTYGLMTVTAVGSGTLAVGQTLSGSGVTSASLLTGLGTGTGGTGTYYVDLTQTASSTTITADATSPVVTYDSVSGGFIVTSGIQGPASTMAFATGTIAAGLMLTQVTGAVLSQGAAAAVPGSFMSALTQVTQNWASFMTGFDPDGGSGNITQRVAFAAWNALQNGRYVYVAWDTSSAPTVTVPATGSLGVVVDASYPGTNVNWEPSDTNIAAFVCGMGASINFDQTNGRITAAFKSQAGLVAGVSSGSVAPNLLSNGYNFYGVYGADDITSSFYYNGSISGPFTWLDTYWNQIWLNNSFILDIVALLRAVNSIPYNAAGYTLVESSLQDTITAAVNSGVIRAGVVLSSTQIAEVNAAAGKNVASVIQSQGWYLQVLPASPSVRAARGSPPINFWYCDGESIQKVSISSIVLQ